MPPSNIPEPQAALIVAYLRSLPGSIATSKTTGLRGDPVNGKAIFDGKGGCVSCHRVQGNGGFLGPDLSSAGITRRSIELERALTHPNADIRTGTRTATVVNKDGTTILGRLLNQDTYSLQLIDAKGKLWSFHKDAVRKWDIPDLSAMPSFADKLYNARAGGCCQLSRDAQGACASRSRARTRRPTCARWRERWIVITIRPSRSIRLAVLMLCLSAASSSAQVTFDRLLRADQEPSNWLTYSGNLNGQRYSLLTQITPQNAKNLQLEWVLQTRAPAEPTSKYEATALVVDGVFYTVQPPNVVIAADAVTGRVFWTYAYTPSPLARACCGRINRGLAILGHTLFMSTIDGNLVGIDARDGRLLWTTPIGRPDQGTRGPSPLSSSKTK